MSPMPIASPVSILGDPAEFIPADLLQSRRVIGDFQLVRELGRGGMGVVFLARQRSLDRLVALKVLPGEFCAEPMRTERFRLEAEVISRLDHPCITPVYGVGEDEGIPFIAMKYLDGVTLDAMIADRKGEDPDAGSGEETLRTAPGDPQVAAPRRKAGADLRMFGDVDSEPGWFYQVMRVMERVARALHYAHGKGVIHRDVKPSNVLIDREGQPWLLDFGLVRDLSAQAITNTDSFLGTAFYVAPEQVRGDRKRTDHRVDVYSLGVTLYELVTLTRPFSYARPDTLFHAIVNEEPQAPRRRNPAIPKDLETVILKAMAKDPEQRYATAEAFADDLKRVRSFEQIHARPTSYAGRVRRWVSKNPVLAGALLFAALCLVGMVEYSVYRDLLDRRRVVETLERADRAFDAGDFDTALREYFVYTGLGGDPSQIRPRMLELAERQRELFRDLRTSGRDPTEGR